MEWIVTRAQEGCQDYLIHYGVKGMKWGVRRYQNKDGSLTPAGKRKALMDDYKKVGASKQLQRSHGYDKLIEQKVLNKTEKALSNLETNSGNSKYTAKKRAKDYDKAIRGINRLKSDQITQTYRDADAIRDNTRKITKLQNKKQTERTERKIKRLVADNDLMQLKMTEASEKYIKYAAASNRLVEQMANDKAVVYTTRYRTLSTTGGDVGYELSGTDYKVRSNTKRRSNSKKYNDPKKKKQYDTELSKYVMLYY